MKKLFIAFLIALMLPIVAAAEVDLSGMSYDELVDLSNKVGKAIMEHENFDSVTVPMGIWEIGVHIPEGTWMLSSKNTTFSSIIYGPSLSENGSSMSIFDDGNTETLVQFGDSFRFVAKKGNFISIKYGPMIFTSESGTSDLGFKKK